MSRGAVSPTPEPEVPQRRRAAVVVAGSLAFVALLTVALIRLLFARNAPAPLSPLPPAGPPLTRHLALIIVDGLRYDVAADPARMPELSRLLRERASGEIWANPISMTSSAILTYATGQRGDIDQIINNESSSAAPYNHLIENARAAGLVTAGTGDRAWFRLFPGAWSLSHPDPAGVAIDVDYNDEIFGAARDFLRATPRPHLMVAHFVTPDHQAHAYGVLSARYAAHIRAFDRELRALLDAVPADTTVFVTSDHGATDTGTHGADTPLQRRSPLVAFGPGIVGGRAEARRLDQVDLPGTFAALLGVASPAHGRGHVLADWLDVPDARRADIACAELARLERYAGTVLAPAEVAPRGAAAACAAEDPRARVAAAAASARALDHALDDVGFSGSRVGWLAPAFAIAGALGLGLLALGRAATARPAITARAAAIALGAMGASVALTWGVERLPGRWPDLVRGALFALANGALLVAVVRRRAALALLDRRVALGAALVPGLLAVSYTKNTQVQAFVLAVVIGALALTGGAPGADAPGAARPQRASGPRLAFVAALTLALVPLAYQESGFLPRALVGSRIGAIAAAGAAIVALALFRFVDPGHAPPAPRSARALALGAGVLAALASLLLRRVAPPAVCLAGWLGLPVLAALAWRARQRPLAELLALGSYAWVSRDPEIPILVATYLVACAVGGALGAAGERETPGAPVRPSVVLLAVTFLFGWTYVQRVGIQLGVDFMQLDWGAGAFRELGVSVLRIGAALSYKHAFARAAILFAVLPALAPATRRWVAQGLFVTELLRVATLVMMLYFCRRSFWTALRVLGDGPHALEAVIVAAAACWAVAAAGRPEARVRPRA